MIEFLEFGRNAVDIYSNRLNVSRFSDEVVVITNTGTFVILRRVVDDWTASMVFYITLICSFLHFCG